MLLVLIDFIGYCYIGDIDDFEIVNINCKKVFEWGIVIGNGYCIEFVFIIVY